MASASLVGTLPYSSARAASALAGLRHLAGDEGDLLEFLRYSGHVGSCNSLMLQGRLAQVGENNKPVLVYSTFPSVAEAERIGGALVDRGLAACVNIFPGMTAIYVWEGKRQSETEAAMIIKTRAELADAVDRRNAQASSLRQPGPGGAAHRRRLGGFPALDRGTDGKGGLKLQASAVGWTVAWVWLGCLCARAGKLHARPTRMTFRALGRL